MHNVATSSLAGGSLGSRDSALKRLLAATRGTEVAEASAAVEAAVPCDWRPVGDNENNLATINLGTDPAIGLIERITNAIDAVLEREWLERGEPRGIRSPRQAVEHWFGVPDGRLGGVVSLREPHVARLSKRVHVTLRDSGNGRRPTVDIRDLGIGIPHGELSDTILSLQRNRKLRKRFLAGEFGQGGSTALSYSEYAIIASRGRGPLGHPLQRVAVTVVRFNPGDPEVDKHGVYEYLVGAENQEALMLELQEEQFPAGTLVRHIEMDLGKYRNALTAPTSSLSYLSNHYLFDPVIPFTLRDARQRNSDDEPIVVGGGHRLLERSDEVEYRRHAKLQFRRGEIRLAWWVLKAKGENARNLISSHTLASKPIVITYNGQKQGELPNTIIKDDMRLPYLERYLIVHVDCDGLDNESRRQLFPTTRESLRNTSLMEELRQLVTDALYGDEELRRLDRERKQRYMRKTDNGAAENIRRRLAKRIKQTTALGDRGRTPRIIVDVGSNGAGDPRPITINDPPTLLDIVGRTPREIIAGRPFMLRFRTDADPSFFERPDAFLVLIHPFRFARYTGRTDVHGGRGVAYFECSEELLEGDRGEITLELWSPKGSPVGSTVDVVVVPPEEAGTDEGKAPTPDINTQWVSKLDPFWIENEWDEFSVARVIRDGNSVEIFVSADNKRLNRLIARGQRRNVDTVQILKDFYLEHISFHALLIDLGREQALSAEGSFGAGGSEKLESEHEYELERACETLCGVMEESFEFFAERASA